jgi:hypothetical protein
MSDIIVPEGVEEENDDQITTNYEATDIDEEIFFLVYNLHFSWEEAERMDSEKRRWVMLRYMAQKNMEREIMIQQRMQQQLMAAGGPGGGLIQR